MRHDVNNPNIKSKKKTNKNNNKAIRPSSSSFPTCPKNSTQFLFSTTQYTYSHDLSRSDHVCSNASLQYLPILYLSEKHIPCQTIPNLAPIFRLARKTPPSSYFPPSSITIHSLWQPDTHTYSTCSHDLSRSDHVCSNASLHILL
jgi:hypothetical protein